MRNSNRGKDLPHVRPVQRIELSESHVKLRMILIVVLLAIATVSIVIALSSALKTEPGWQEIRVASVKMNCGEDFTLSYDFTNAGSAATAQSKALTTLYSTACEDAFRIFSPDVSGEGTANVCDLNAHPNETLTVDPVLYQALSLIQQYGNRNLYLGAVYAEYNRIFWAENDVEAASYDPVQNPELVGDLAELAAFANDPAMIDVQLLDNHQVKLMVAEEYLSFVKDNEIEKLIDFGWMKNAFIADYLAQVLADNGYTDGYIASFDGFTRNLDQRANTYSINLFDRIGFDIYHSAVMRYEAPASIVSLRDYPLGQSDQRNYYAFPGGHIASFLIDPADGMCKASVDSLIAYGKNQSCAEILLQLVPVFIADTFSNSRLLELASSGIHSLWCEGQSVYHTDAQVDLTILPQDNMTYTKVFAG